MERVYNFIKITLLGLIMGALIILLLQINFWGVHIQKILRKPVPYDDNEDKNERLENNTEKLPLIKPPPEPKYKI